MSQKPHNNYMYITKSHSNLCQRDSFPHLKSGIIFELIHCNYEILIIEEQLLEE